MCSRSYVSPDAVMGDARSDLTDYIRTKQVHAEHHAGGSAAGASRSARSGQHTRSLAGVPADQQQNVRNDMYVESEALRLMAKSGSPKFTSPEECSSGQLQEAPRSFDQVHSDLGEGRGGAGTGPGHDGRLEAHRGDGRREDRQGRT